MDFLEKGDEGDEEKESIPTNVHDILNFGQRVVKKIHVQRELIQNIQNSDNGQ